VSHAIKKAFFIFRGIKPCVDILARMCGIYYEQQAIGGVELDDFTLEVAIESAVCFASQVSQDSPIALDMQANVEPSIALQMLKGRS